MKQIGTGMVRCGFSLFCLLGMVLIASMASMLLGYFQFTSILLMPVFLYGTFMVFVIVGIFLLLLGMILERVGS